MRHHDLAMNTLIKYPGGKEKELKVIRPMLPQNINNYYEPFVGGGAVLWHLNLGRRKFINDISKDLVNFYICVQIQDEEFFECLENWNDQFHLAANMAADDMDEIVNAFCENRDPDIDETVKPYVIKKFAHIHRKAEKNNEVVEAFEENVEAAYKQALYSRARNEYNASQIFDGRRAALYVLMRQYGFSGMFRYNADGDFNIPYGGIPYNNKYLDERIRLMKSGEVISIMRNTVIGNEDFEQFMHHNPPGQNDFIFIDPPYDTTFSSYDNIDFDRLDQHRLSNYLINNCMANWMVVIKATDYIRHLYPENMQCINGGEIHIYEFDKKYDVCMKGRNEQRCEHLLITNY